MRLFAVLTAALFLAVAAPASAGTLTTQNTCLTSFDVTWRQLNIELGGTATPAPVAPGGTVTLTGTVARAQFPEYLIRVSSGQGGPIHAGENVISARVWLALAAPGTTQGTVVHEATATGRTTVTYDANGFYQSSTPVDVAVPLPDSAWTAGTSAIGFRQAGGGSLPRVPAGPNGAMVQPQGSLLISVSFENGFRVNFDCQPGSGEGKALPAFAEAGLFETVAVGANTEVPAPAKKPVVSLRTTKLKRTGSRVSVALACAAAPCKGRVSLGAAGAKTLSYSLAAGARKTYKLKLSQRALKRLKTKSLVVTVKVTTTGGKTVTKKLRLRK